MKLVHLKKYPFFGIGFGSYGAYISDTYKYLTDKEIIIISATFQQVCPKNVAHTRTYNPKPEIECRTQYIKDP